MTKRIYGFRTSKAVKGLGVAVIGLTIFGTSLVSANELSQTDRLTLVAETAQGAVSTGSQSDVVVLEGRMLVKETVIERPNHADLETARQAASAAGVTLEVTPTEVLNTTEGVEADFENQIANLDKAREAQVLHDTTLADAKKKAVSAGVTLTEHDGVTYRNDGDKAKADVEAQLKALEEATSTKAESDERFKEAVDLAKKEGVAVTVGDSVTHQTPADAWKDALAQIEAVETAKRVQFEVDALIDKQKQEATKAGLGFELGATVVVSDEATAKAKVTEMTTLVKEASDLKAQASQLVKDLTAKAQASGTVVRETAPITLSYKAIDQAMADLSKQVDGIIEANKATRKAYEAEKAEADQFNKAKADKNARITADNNKLIADYDKAMAVYKTSHAEWTKAKADFLAQEQAKKEANTKAIAEAKAHNDKVEADHNKALADWEIAKANVKPSNEAEVKRIKAENEAINQRNEAKRQAHEAALADYQANPGGGVTSDPSAGKPVLIDKDGVKVVGEFDTLPRGSYDNYKKILTVAQEGSSKVLKAPFNTKVFTDGPVRLKANESHITPVVAETTDGTPIKVKITNKKGKDVSIIDGFIRGQDEWFDVNGASFNYDFEFLNANTNQPISLVLSFIIDDIDPGQELTFEFNEKMIGVVSPERETNVRTKLTDTTAHLTGFGIGGAMTNGIDSAPLGTALIVGKGSKFNYSTPDTNVTAIFAKAGMGEVRLAPKRQAPVAPTYEALKPVPTLEAGVIPPKPTKGALRGVPSVYDVKSFDTKEPQAPTKPSLTPLDTRPDKVVKVPIYQVATVHGFEVKLEKGDLYPIQMSVSVHGVDIEVATHQVAQVVDTHDVMLEKEQFKVVATPEWRKPLEQTATQDVAQPLVKQATSAPTQKAVLPKTGEAGSVLGLVGTILSGFSLVGLKHRKKA